jgi:hypothetical protein
MGSRGTADIAHTYSAAKFVIMIDKSYHQPLKQHFRKIHLQEAELFHVDGQTGEKDAHNQTYGRFPQ